MLRQRVITALILIPLVVGGILYLDNVWFALVLGLVMLIGVREMAGLANLSGLAPRGAFIVAVALLCWGGWISLDGDWAPVWLGAVSAWWLVVSMTLLSRRRALPRIETVRPAILLLGALVIVSAWLSIVLLHGRGDHGPKLVLFLFVLIWIADSGAYFAGRAFGRRKLSPLVSPGKTWEGAAGALVSAVLAASLLHVSEWVPGVSPWWLVLLCVVVTLVSIGGDLWESRLKREAGVKDSGALLPGHGGLLDRIDSLLAAAPVFLLGLTLAGEAA